MITAGRLFWATLVCLSVGGCLEQDATAQNQASGDLRAASLEAMKRAATYYVEKLSAHGGYVYHYALGNDSDSDQALEITARWGEGPATNKQIWVQPPGTPTVGLAFLKAFEASGDSYYLQAAQAAAEALVYGQLKSGGWTNCVDFDPQGSHVAAYRNGKGQGKNNSSLDDGQTQSALLLLIQVDAALDFRHESIHQSAQIGLSSLLAAQYPCGAFPQVWSGPRVATPQPQAANYPEFDWRVDGKIKNYWSLYTLNDDLAVYTLTTLLAANDAYHESQYLESAKKLGDFLILSQMPEPQPAWAQQYNFQMQPTWARRFEPPAISGHESQGIIEVLMSIYRASSDKRYLEPIPAALEYLRRSQLPDGRLARYYELRSNRPLYMQRSGDQYSLTYSDLDLPAHYGWKFESRLPQLRQEYAWLATNGPTSRPASPPGVSEIREILRQLDSHGRWVSTFSGQRLVGQPKFRNGDSYISSQVFSDHLSRLANFVQFH